MWYLIPRVNTKWLNLVYQNFAVDAGISEKKKVLLVEDNAGWHSSKKAEIPEGITIEFLPPYSTELYAKRYPLGQPAERFWTLVDEPLVNENFEREGCWGFPSISNHAVGTIDEIEELLVKRCNVLR